MPERREPSPYPYGEFFTPYRPTTTPAVTPDALLFPGFSVAGINGVLSIGLDNGMRNAFALLEESYGESLNTTYGNEARAAVLLPDENTQFVPYSEFDAAEAEFGLLMQVNVFGLNILRKLEPGTYTPRNLFHELRLCNGNEGEIFSIANPSVFPEGNLVIGSMGNEWINHEMNHGLFIPHKMWPRVIPNLQFGAFPILG